MPDEFVQVGVTALRDPKTGDFLPAVPLYIKATPEVRESEAAMLDDIASLFKDKMKQYIDGGGRIAKTGNRQRKESAASGKG